MMRYMDSGSLQRLYMFTIQMIDPFVKDIAKAGGQVELLFYNFNEKEWCTSDIRGTIFVYNRYLSPGHCICIYNHGSKTAFIDPIEVEMIVWAETTLLLYKKSQKHLNAIGFSNDDECKDFVIFVQSLKNKLAYENLGLIGTGPLAANSGLAEAEGELIKQKTDIWNYNILAEQAMLEACSFNMPLLTKPVDTTLVNPLILGNNFADVPAIGALNGSFNNLSWTGLNGLSGLTGLTGLNGLNGLSSLSGLNGSNGLGSLNSLSNLSNLDSLSGLSNLNMNSMGNFVNAEVFHPKNRPRFTKTDTPQVAVANKQHQQQSQQSQHSQQSQQSLFNEKTEQWDNKQIVNETQIEKTAVNIENMRPSVSVKIAASDIKSQEIDQFKSKSDAENIEHVVNVVKLLKVVQLEVSTNEIKTSNDIIKEPSKRSSVVKITGMNEQIPVKKPKDIKSTPKHTVTVTTTTDNATLNSAVSIGKKTSKKLKKLHKNKNQPAAVENTTNTQEAANKQMKNEKQKKKRNKKSKAAKKAAKMESCLSNNSANSNNHVNKSVGPKNCSSPGSSSYCGGNNRSKRN